MMAASNVAAAAKVEGELDFIDEIEIEEHASQLANLRVFGAGIEREETGQGVFHVACTDLDEDGTVYEGTDAVVTAYVLTEEQLAYSNVDSRDGETVIYLRNN